MKTKEYKNFYIDLITKIAPMATEYLASGHLKLAPGTYSATEICKIQRHASRDFVKENFLKAEQIQDCDNQEELTEWDRKYVRYVNHEFGWEMIPIGNAFHFIKEYEKEAGLSGKKRISWTVEEIRQPVAQGYITFPSEKIMKNRARTVKSYNKAGHRFSELSLADGCFRGVYTKSENREEEHAVYKHKPISFSWSEGYEDVCVCFTHDQIKHLYGECKIHIYGDIYSKEPRNRFCVIIENEDGWKVSTTVVSTYKGREKIKEFDAQFINDKELLSAGVSLQRCAALTPDTPQCLRQPDITYQDPEAIVANGGVHHASPPYNLIFAKSEAKENPHLSQSFVRAALSPAKGVPKRFDGWPSIESYLHIESNTAN